MIRFGRLLVLFNAFDKGIWTRLYPSFGVGRFALAWIQPIRQQSFNPPDEYYGKWID